MLSKFEYSIPDNLDVYMICGKSNWTTDKGKKQSVIRFEPIDPITLKPKTSFCALKINDTAQRYESLCFRVFEDVILGIDTGYFPGFNCVKSFYYYVSHASK